jgi:hypothetical protein
MNLRYVVEQMEKRLELTVFVAIWSAAQLYEVGVALGKWLFSVQH